MANPQQSTTVITEAVGDGLGVFDTHHKRSFVLNATSALVFQHCDGQTTPRQLTERLRQKFNLPGAQAEQLLALTLNELHNANLIQANIERPANPGRRQLFKTMLAAGLSLALLPIVAPVNVQAKEKDKLIPLLDCVVNNGNGTYTAYFGYKNVTKKPITLAVGSRNKFEPSPKGRGQPTVFQPGEYHNVFAVTFNGSKIKWKLKAHDDHEHQVHADDDLGCAVPLPTTTVAPPTTTTGAPTTTTGAPTTTTAAPPPTTTAAPPPTTTAAPPPTTTAAPPPTTTAAPPPTTTGVPQTTTAPPPPPTTGIQT